MSINVMQTIVQALADGAAQDLKDLADPWLLAWLGVAIFVVVSVVKRSPPLDRVRRRMGPGDSRSMLLLIVSSAVFAYLATEMSYVQALGVKQAEAISDRDMVRIATLADLAAAAVMVILTVGLRERGIKRIGLDIRHAVVALVQAPAFLVLVYPIMGAVGLIGQYVWDRFHTGAAPEHEMIKILQANPGASLKWMITISAVIAAPLAEELFFRGYLQTLVRELPLPPWAAILVSSVAFTLVHSPPEIWPVIFVLAVGLGYIYERTGNLATTMLMHALFNGAQIWLVSHGGG
jgi:membrane protease YdiL (CAAX protease family)